MELREIWSDMCKILDNSHDDAVMYVAGMRYNLLNPSMAVDCSVDDFVDGMWMTIVRRLIIVRTSDSFLVEW